jgi:DNA-binding SARP family transcriptional activator
LLAVGQGKRRLAATVSTTASGWSRRGGLVGSNRLERLQKKLLAGGGRLTLRYPAETQAVCVVVEHLHDSDRWLLQLIGGFELSGPDGEVDVPPGVQRLLAYIALQGGAVSRTRAGGDLWPGVAAAQAGANLRSTLWRTRRVGPLVCPGSRTLRLEPTVSVDVHALTREGAASLPVRQPGRAFNFELLPDWVDDWVTIERERLRLLELQLLDTEAEQLVGRGQVAEALDTTLRAIRLEPLREASHQALIRIFLTAGDRSAAVSHYERFVALMREELDLWPDPMTTALVAPYLPNRRGTGTGRKRLPRGRNRRGPR